MKKSGPVVKAVPQRSLQWITDLLESATDQDDYSFALIAGRQSLSPRVMVAIRHQEWGDCFVRVAEGEDAEYLRNEHSTLSKCHQLGLTAHVPEILHWVDAPDWVAIVTPRYTKAKLLPLRAAASLISPIHLATGTHVPLRDTPVLDGIQDWYQDLGKQDTGVENVLRAASRLETPILASMVHRDFWWGNILANGKHPAIIDWEHSAPDFPAVFDFFQYYVLLAPPGDQLARVGELIQSPRVAFPSSEGPQYLESQDHQALQVIVGVWLADYLGIRVKLALESALTDPYELIGWSWIAMWNSLAKG